MRALGGLLAGLILLGMVAACGGAGSPPPGPVAPAATNAPAATGAPAAPAAPAATKAPQDDYGY
jgi:hypothetical protein